MTPAATEWRDANQQHLISALARVRARLERHPWVRRGEAVPDPARGTSPSTVEEAPAPMALDSLCLTFRLSGFERDLLLLCAGIELDSAFGALCAEIHGDVHRPYATFSLALAALPEPHWSALTPDGPLRRWRMIEVGSGHALTTSPLRIDERVLHHLAGLDGTDHRLAGMIRRSVAAEATLAPSHQAIASHIQTLWRDAAGRSALPLVQLCGSDLAASHSIAHAIVHDLGLELRILAADALPTLPSDIETVSRLWQREAALSGAVLLIEFGDVPGSDQQRSSACARFLEQTPGALFLATRERGVTGQRAAVTYEVPKPSREEQRAAWRAALGDHSERLNGQIALLASHFDLGLHAIHTAAVDALGRGGAADASGLTRAVWDACRHHSRPRLEDLAQRIEPRASWEDLVLPEPQRQLLREVAVHVRQRGTVYEHWGFGRLGDRGLGISALFSGASGTGKTMAAEVLAGELQLDLYRIDLSSVVSKYIGETEKNLRRIFDAAEEAGAVLLFDEADALFGKRSEVKDSHDRYANIEVSYLLQRMECYRGLAILTTNIKSAVDAAFLRRIRFVVQFPFPDEFQRAEIWQRAFPPAAPTHELDPALLAQLNVAGGNIRNIALHAAFLAADAGEPVHMGHLLRAARTEYSKIEKALTDSEIAGWVSHAETGT